MPRTLVAVAVAALVASAAAFAAPERHPVRPNTRDQAAARAATLRNADFQVAAGWTREPTKVDLERDPRCADFRPRWGDLLITGTAASAYTSGVVTIGSEARVLRTRAMMQIAWRRTFGHSRLIPCLRTTAVRDLRRNGMRLMSLRPLAFPRLTPNVTAYRVLARPATGPSTRRTRQVVDVVVVAKGRTQIRLVAAASQSSQVFMEREHRRLARRLVARVRT